MLVGEQGQKEKRKSVSGEQGQNGEQVGVSGGKRIEKGIGRCKWGKNI